MPATVPQIRARRKTAQTEKDQFATLLDDAYEYAIPYRRGVQKSSKGEQRVNRVFDSTAVVSAFRFAGRVQNDIVPPGFFSLAPGPLVPKSERQDLAKLLEPVSEVIAGTFASGEWDQAVHEMGVDLGAGTGAILSLKGTKDKPVRDIAVPIDELLLEGGPYNDITGIFWARKWTLRAIEDEFPAGNFTEEFKKLLAKDEEKEKEVELFQDTVWDPKISRWCRYVHCAENKDIFIEKTETRTCPWITPRYFRVPGETYGRGPILLAMPTIRTLNVAQKIMLQAAAIAMLGIYTAIDDGVFNPDNAPLQPGAFWKVARNGGVLGPSVQRFPDPRIDLTGIILDKLVLQVQAAMNDQALPAETGAVRSPTEIIERVKRLAHDHLGAFGRLVRELIVPAVRRRMEICYDLGLIQNETPIDQLLVRVDVQSPMAIAREVEKLERIVQYIQIVLGIVPQRLRQLIKIDEALGVDIAGALRIPPSLIPTKEEREQMDKEDAETQAAAVAAAAAGGGDLSKVVAPA